ARQAAVRAARKRRRAWILAIAALSALLVVALVGIAYINEQKDIARIALAEAVEQRNVASATGETATQTANGIIKDVAADFGRGGLPLSKDVAADFGRGGLPLSLVKKLLERAQTLQKRLESLGGSTPELVYGRATGLNELALTFATLGNSDLS